MVDPDSIFKGCSSSPSSSEGCAGTPRDGLRMMVAFLACFLKKLGAGTWSKMMLLLFRLLLWFWFWLPSCGWLQICGSLTNSVIRCASGSLVSSSSA